MPAKTLLPPMSRSPDPVTKIEIAVIASITKTRLSVGRMGFVSDLECGGRGDCRDRIRCAPSRVG